MKRREKQRLFNYAKKQYNEIFDLNLEFKYLSKKELYKLLKQYEHSTMCEWSYCCYGLFDNCWQELYEEGNWGLSQEKVNTIIENTIDKTSKACRRDNRILYCKTDNEINVFIITRDIFANDYLITFTNK